LNNGGKAGCGCLIFILIVVMVATGVFMHPLTLRFIANQFRYEDKIFPSSAIFVPRFQEDKAGELYVEAFRDYWAGNGKVIWIEDEKILGMSIIEMIHGMAKARNVREDAVRRLEVGSEQGADIVRIKERFERLGCTKVIILVPEYASRRFHLLYDSSGDDGRTIFLVKPVSVSYFKKETWWKDPMSRHVLANEIRAAGSYFLRRFTGGSKGREGQERRDGRDERQKGLLTRMSTDGLRIKADEGMFVSAIAIDRAMAFTPCRFAVWCPCRLKSAWGLTGYGRSIS